MFLIYIVFIELDHFQAIFSQLDPCLQISFKWLVVKPARVWSASVKIVLAKLSLQFPVK
jgi:hypothetical protein